MNKAHLLIDRPHSYRDWKITGPSEVRGFHHLESNVRVGVDYYTERMTYTKFELCLHESQFERVQ